MKAIELLKPFNPCHDAVAWLSEKTIDEAWDTCPRGDWMLWAYTKLRPDDVRGRVAAAAECAATVSHLLTDPRSLAAIEAARAFGRGEIDAATLKIAAEAAARAAADAAADAAAWAVEAAADAADAAADAVEAAAWAAARAAAEAAAWAAEAAARAARVEADAAADTAIWAAAWDKSLFEMANICRELLKI